jgi:membrane protease YdiL (CAAX protease family)
MSCPREPRPREGGSATRAPFAWLAAGLLWQLALPVALLAATAVGHLVPDSRIPPLVLGKTPIGFTSFAGFVTPGALAAWVYLLKPDISDLTGMIPDQPVWLLALGGLVFALVNATFEEWVWRGVFQPTLEREFGVAWAIVLQAVSFGVAHAHGFPRGAVGIVQRLSHEDHLPRCHLRLDADLRSRQTLGRAAAVSNGLSTTSDSVGIPVHGIHTFVGRCLDLVAGDRTAFRDRAAHRRAKATFGAGVTFVTQRQVKKRANGLACGALL